MENDKSLSKTKASDTKKENQDLANIPAASEKINSEKTVKKQIRESSRLHKDGKTDNTEKNSEN
ncbi:MAG: hypothetical protein L6264_09845 [Weeksellaceae bacterium]|nr:hypothetical protein [Bacteroidota bacterium]MCG2781241.1 hypothetical protein [Weeksellaceae bacterium]